MTFRAAKDKSKILIESFNDTTESTILNYINTTTVILKMIQDGFARDYRHTNILHMKFQVECDHDYLDNTMNSKLVCTTFLKLVPGTQVVNLKIHLLINAQWSH